MISIKELVKSYVEIEEEWESGRISLEEKADKEMDLVMDFIATGDEDDIETLREFANIVLEVC